MWQNELINAARALVRELASAQDNAHASAAQDRQEILASAIELQAHMIKHVNQSDQISRLEISGYKSIAKCDLELGRLNVLICANGAGK